MCNKSKQTVPQFKDEIVWSSREFLRVVFFFIVENFRQQFFIVVLVPILITSFFNNILVSLVQVLVGQVQIKLQRFVPSQSVSREFLPRNVPFNSKLKCQNRTPNDSELQKQKRKEQSYHIGHGKLWSRTSPSSVATLKEFRLNMVSTNRKIDVRTAHIKFSLPEQNENDTSSKLQILKVPLLGIHHHGDIMSHFRYANQRK